MPKKMSEKNPEVVSKAQVPLDVTVSDKDPLSILDVITRLEVGLVRLEKRRLIAPYKIVQKRKVDTFNLEYSFEEDVFDPSEPASINLSSMIAAQVALNYGLFCKEIVFHGIYDQEDRKFIEDMATNTAREIFVKKFLQPNPFLHGPAVQLTPIKLEKYLRAKIIFADDRSSSNYGEDERNTPIWVTDGSQHAVLASGGKDSLLSFGLLRELGYKVHSIFLNESGRHWFTALNAYRYFKANYPETVRVWTNSDRVFAWILRHLPFIRKDFADVRSDEYPIRLWTVAVFLFGALPVLRKRGIGRLVIGDEFDTTSKVNYKGITNYDGLYDQSRYFDNTLTRYFMSKGWGISQFSILRPLSEILIEKILVTRYPELQKHQVSCHAAHTDGDCVRPCGKCEKCRRIVGMLIAVGADPSRCGYTKMQVEYCLKALEEKNVHQEAAGVQQLNYLLMEKGLISKTSKKPGEVRQRPEIMKLRFDSERSPIESIPTDLRQPLYKIYLELADGAVKRSGRVWVEFDPLSGHFLSKPYPFKSPSKKSGISSQGNPQTVSSKNSYLLGELTWPEAKERFKEVDIALLPVGSIEQHGPHLPLDTDAFDVDYLARQVAAACSDPKPLVLPLIPYGVSYHHEDFSGTISVSNETLTRLVYEVGMSVAHNGATKLLIINGHGGNTPALQFAAQMINRDTHIFTCVDTGETSDTDIDAMTETPNDVHAGEIETSTTMAIRPNLVRLDKAQKFVPRFSSRYLDFTSKRSVEWYARTAKISSTGVLGDPTKASREKGEKIWAIMIKNLVEFVEGLKSMSLNEIYEKRY